MSSEAAEKKPKKNYFTGLFKKKNKPDEKDANKAPMQVDATKLTLQGSGYHSTQVRALNNSSALLQPGTGRYHWYRADPGGTFDPICETEFGTYQPSILDVGCRICCQWVPEEGLPSAFSEWGPLAMDPMVAEDIARALADQEARQFEVLASDKQTPLTLHISPTELVISPIGGDPAASAAEEAPSSSPPPAASVDKDHSSSLSSSSSSSSSSSVSVSVEAKAKNGNANANTAPVFSAVLGTGPLPEGEERCSISLNARNPRKLKLSVQTNASAKPSVIRVYASSHTVRDVICRLVHTYTGVETDPMAEDPAPEEDASQEAKGEAKEALEDARESENPDDHVVSVCIVPWGEGVAAAKIASRKDSLGYNGDAASAAGEVRRLKNIIKRGELEFADKTARINADNSALSREKKKLLARVASLEGEAASLESVLGHTRSERDMAQAEYVKSAQEQQRLLTLTESGRALAESLEELKRSVKAKDIQISNLESRCKRVDDSNKALYEEKQAAERKMSELMDFESANNALRKDVQALQDAMAAATSVHEETKAALTSQQITSAQEASSVREALEAELAASLVVVAETRAALQEEKLGAEEQLKALSDKLALQKDSTTEMLSQRNFFKKKCESVTQQIQKLLQKGGVGGMGSPNGHASSSSGPTTPKSRVGSAEGKHAQLAKEKEEAEMALEAFQKAFNEQLLQLKREREANLQLASRNAKRGDFAVKYQLQNLNDLCNSLSEAVSDKDTALTHMRHSNKILGERCQVLEKKLQLTELAEAN